MWLLLCDRGDLPALWAYQGLGARGLALELVTTELLRHALGWGHRLGREGTTVRIELADGRTIDSGRIRGVLNRVAFVPPPAAGTVGPDQAYAQQELHAFWLSWLASLPGPILNPPSPQGLGGPWYDQTEWLMLAARARLATVPYGS